MQKQLIYLTPIMTFQNQNQSRRTPNAEVIDLETEQKVKDIYVAICVAKEKLDKSPFYSQFVEQMEHEEMVEQIESIIAIGPRYS